MKAKFDYDVVIDGLENVPLKTTKEGALNIIQALTNTDPKTIMDNMNDGIAFRNELATITKRNPKKKK